MKRIPWLTVTTASLTLLLAGASLGGFAQYDRSAILRGEPWRLVTGHFSHWSASHLGYDLIAFVILGAICERRSRGLFATTVIATAAVVSLFLLAFRPDMELYRGLSAIDSALWMLAAAGLVGRRAAALGALFLTKVLIESYRGPLFVGGITVLPVVHLIGAAVGIMASWRASSYCRRTRSATCAGRSTRSPAPSSSTASSALPAPT